MKEHYGYTFKFTLLILYVIVSLIWVQKFTYLLLF